MERLELNTTKESIIEAAIDVFSENDFHRASMRQIAKRANIGLSTIYEYFDSKESLIFSVHQIIINRLVSKIKEHLKGIEGAFNKLRKIIWITVESFVIDKRSTATVYITLPLRSWIDSDTYRASTWNRMVLEIFKEGQTKGEIRDDMDAIIMMDTVQALIERSFYVSLFRTKKICPDEDTAVIMEIIVKSFRKEASV